MTKPRKAKRVVAWAVVHPQAGFMSAFRTSRAAWDEVRVRVAWGETRSRVVKLVEEGKG